MQMGKSSRRSVPAVSEEQLSFDRALDRAEEAVAELHVQLPAPRSCAWASSRARRLAGLSKLAADVSAALEGAAVARAKQMDLPAVVLGPGGEFGSTLCGEPAGRSIVSRVLARLSPWQRPVPGRYAISGRELGRARIEADFGPDAAAFDEAMREVRRD